jgi:asparagine synthase (glutamine-hydrolysing)
MFRYYNHLCFNNPYYYEKAGKFEIHKNFPGMIDRFSGKRKIDPVAVIELLNKTYILADRTIIQGIQRTPWLAKPNEQSNKWIFDKAPEHGNIDISEAKIAKTLFQKICSEIELYIGEKKKVGILLSGGMDSRMVAGSLDYLVKTGRLRDLEITGLTWGNEGTRDVVYAKKIAERLGWNWKHYAVTAKDLLNNITETAINGCEYSPIHLHAIPQIRDDNEVDLQIILAGSYGDSVGRAEYAGKKVRHLKPLLHNVSNVGNFIYKDIYDNSFKYLSTDIDRYHQQFPKQEEYMQNELDYQLHYMRRMLNPCMELLTEKMEFQQVFTHPDVFGYMWSISPERRNDLVYKNMLNEFITKLDDIPWARTGLPYGHKEGKPDNYLKAHHSYVKQLQHILLKEIDKETFFKKIEAYGVFNLKAIKIWFKLLKIFPVSNRYFLEKLVWLVSLSEMFSIYDMTLIKRMENHHNQSNNHLLFLIIFFEYLKTNIPSSIKIFLKRLFRL